MKRTFLCLLAVSSLAAAPGFAHAQAWNVNERQAALEARIDTGVRQRTITPLEATQLRGEFQAIAGQEAIYRSSAPGLTDAERDDLNRRFDILSAKIRIDRTDNDNTGGWNVNQRQIDLNARIDMGVRQRTITPIEADRLREESRNIARQEEQYRASGRGLDRDERAELDRRFNDLAARINTNRTDDDRRWSNLNQRQAMFSQRLDQAVRERRLSRYEAANLRGQFNSIADLERRYRMSRPGITANERADLNVRFDRMEATFRSYVRGGNGFDDLFNSLFGRS